MVWGKFYSLTCDLENDVYPYKIHPETQVDSLLHPSSYLIIFKFYVLGL
jgi:hypothetical protein